jgi:hypothetical protein
MILVGIDLIELDSECIDQIKSYMGLRSSSPTYKGRGRSRKVPF